VLVARGSIREVIDERGMEAEVDRRLAERVKEASVAAMDRGFVRQQIREQLRAQFQIVRPGMARRWVMDFGVRASALRETPLSVRAKFIAAQPTPSGTYYGTWEIGPPEGQRYRPETMSLASDTFYEFVIPPGLIASDGKLSVDFLNYNDSAVLFPSGGRPGGAVRRGRVPGQFLAGHGDHPLLDGAVGGDRAGGREFSFLSGGGIPFVGAVGGGFFDGHPAAGGDGGRDCGVNSNTGMVDEPGLIDQVTVRVFGGLLAVITLVQDFSPVESLSTGRSVTWGKWGARFCRWCC
jgi:hypothetical protein